MGNNTYKVHDRVGYCGERCSEADYEKQKEALSKFTVLKRYPAKTNWCGNIRAIFYNGEARLEDAGCSPNSIGVSSQKEISSALALYRLLSALQAPPLTKHADFYKINWEYILRHKKTRRLLIFGEWKGGFQIFTEFYNVSDIPPKYGEDVEKLLTLLVSRNWPIGYDGTVAGEVA